MALYGNTIIINNLEVDEPFKNSYYDYKISFRNRIYRKKLLENDVVEQFVSNLAKR